MVLAERVTVPDSLWRCAHPLHDVLLAWEGEQHAVFFNPATGDTHLVGAIALLLIDLLGTQLLERSQLHECLSQAFADEQTTLPDDLLDSHLQRLSAIGLLTDQPA